MKSLIAFILTLFTASVVNGQTVHEIVGRIRKVNEVHCEGVSITGEKSNQFKNYEELSIEASEAELLRLTYDSSGVVNCYAAWALIARNYSYIQNVFNKFLMSDKEITTFCGCFMEEGNLLSSEVYHRYWNTLCNKLKDTNKTLIAMDSAILYCDHSDRLLIHRALQNRSYPASYNKQIEHLAFAQYNKDAIFYFLRKNEKSYRNQVKQGLTSYLQKTDFSKTGVSDYYDIISELLKYKDKKTDQIILSKLNDDSHWQHEYGKFLILLNDHYSEKDLPEYKYK